MSGFNEFDQIEASKQVDKLSSEYEEGVNKIAPKFNFSMETRDCNKAQKEIHDLTNELKNHFDDFNKIHLPLTQFSQSTIIQHRLKIARKMKNLHNLYDQFNEHYQKSIDDKKILDILLFVKFYNMMQDDLEKLSKITICGRIKEEVYQKIQNTKEILISTINYIKYDNLSTTDIFQLIIISSSPTEFWNFFNFYNILDEKLFQPNNKLFQLGDTSKLVITIQNFAFIHEKIKQISKILEQSQLNDYIESNDLLKTRIEEKLLSCIQHSIDIFQNSNQDNISVEPIFKQIEEYHLLIENSFFSENFHNELKGKINNYSKLLYVFLFKIQSNNIKKKEYVEFLISITNFFQKNLDSSDIQNLNQSPLDNLAKIFLYDFQDIYPDDKSTLIPMLSFANQATQLIKLIYTIPNMIPSFRTLFIKLANILLISIKFIMMNKYSVPSQYGIKEYKPGIDMPKEIKKFLLQDNVDLHSTVGIYQLLLEILKIDKESIFKEHFIFIQKFPFICIRIFYDISLMQSEDDFSKFLDNDLFILFSSSSGISIEELQEAAKNSSKIDYKAAHEKFTDKVSTFFKFGRKK